MMPTHAEFSHLALRETHTGTVSYYVSYALRHIPKSSTQFVKACSDMVGAPDDTCVQTITVSCGMHSMIESPFLPKKLGGWNSRALHSYSANPWLTCNKALPHSHTSTGELPQAPWLPHWRSLPAGLRLRSRPLSPCAASSHTSPEGSTPDKSGRNDMPHHPPHRQCTRSCTHVF